MRKCLTMLMLLSSFTMQIAQAQTHASESFPASNQKIQSLLEYCRLLRLNKNNDPDNYKKLQQAGLNGLQLVHANNAADKASFSQYAALGYYYQLKFDSAQYFFYQSLHDAQEAKSTKLIAAACEALMSINFQLQQPEKVEQCKAILQSISDTTKNASLLKDIFSAFGSYYQQKDFFSTAQDYFINSISIREKELDTAKDAKTKFDYAIQCDQLSKLYLNTNMPDKSLDALRKGQRFDDVSPLVKNRLLSSFVEAFTTSGNIDSALYYLKLLEANAHDQLSFSSELVSSDLNIVIYYIGQKQYDKALPYLDKGFDLATKTQTPLLIFQAQMIKGQYLEETGKYEEAIALLKQALPIAKQLNQQLYANIMKSMALAYQGLGNLKLAVQYYQQNSELQDTLTKEKVSRTFADLETHYETNEKENRIVLLNQKNELAQLQLRQASSTKILLISGLISLGIFFMLLYIFYRNKEKLNKILSERNSRLDELNNQLSIANDTKTKLFGVISHDLRAPVSRIVNLLHLQKEKSHGANQPPENEYTDRLNKASENVLETMEDLLLWSKSQMQHFKPSISRVRIEPLLQKEIAFLEEQIKEKELFVKLNANVELIQNTDENFLSVILRNLLQNAISQSADNSTIQILADEKIISISNEKTGKDAADLNSLLLNTNISSAPSGFGLKIVKELATSIGLQIFFKDEAENRLAAVLSWT